MKILIFFLLLAPVLTDAQQLVLLDRNFKEPIMPCEQLSADSVNTETFPMYAADITQVINRLEQYARHLASGKNLPWPSDTLAQGNALLLLTQDANNFTCVLETQTEPFWGSLILAYGNSRKQTLLRLNKFVEYLRNNRSGVLATAGSSRR